MNADTIAAGLAGRAPEQVSMQAARLMVLRLRELAKARASFAFETNLASRSHAAFVRKLQAEGYQVALCFFALGTANEAVRRVSLRVALGGRSLVS